MPDDEGADGDSDGLRLHDNRNVLNMRCRIILEESSLRMVLVTCTYM